VTPNPSGVTFGSLNEVNRFYGHDGGESASVRIHSLDRTKRCRIIRPSEGRAENHRKILRTFCVVMVNDTDAGVNVKFAFEGSV
jgi:hypothetical protein